MPLAVLTLLCTLAVAVDDDGDAFTRLPFEEAVERARSEDRLLVVHFMAGWSGPCRIMNRKTFTDERVVAWMADHGLAIKVDVDKRDELKRRYQVVTVPTVVALRDGLEVGRFTGDQKVEGLLEWLAQMDAIDESVEVGGVRLPAPRNAPDVQAVLRDVTRASQDGRLEEALAGTVWLWRRGPRHDPGFAGTTRSLVLAEIAELASRDDRAAKALGELLKELEVRLVGDSASQAWIDCIDLSAALGRQDHLIGWVREHRDDAGRLGPGADGTAADVPAEAVERLFGVLAERGLHGEAARLLPDLATLASDCTARHALLRAQLAGEQLEEAVRAEILASQDRQLRGQLVAIYRAALTLDDPEPARRVGERLIAVVDDASSRLALVTAALSAGVAGEAQRAWLEQAAALATSDADRQSVQRLSEQLAAASEHDAAADADG